MSSLQKMMSVFMLNSEVGSDLKMALTMGAFAKTKQSETIAKVMTAQAVNKASNEKAAASEDADLAKDALTAMALGTIGPDTLTQDQRDTLASKQSQSVSITEKSMAQYTALPKAEQTAAQFDAIFTGNFAVTFAGDPLIAPIISDIKNAQTATNA